MLNVQFAPSSLLYGESVFWLATAFLAPFIWTPDFAATRNRFVVQDLPHSRALISWHERLTKRWLVRAFWPRLTAAAQLVYLALFVLIGIAVQRRMLESFGVFQTASLTYKMLYYSPTVSRVGLMIVSVVAIRRAHYSAWANYDQANFFAVSHSFQRKAVLLALLSITPDCLVNVSETFFILTFIGSSDLVKRLRSQLAADEQLWLQLATMAVYLACFGLSTVNVLLRYKPLIDLMYLCACLRKHIEFISAQIGAAADEEAAAAKLPRASAAGSLAVPSAPIKVRRISKTTTTTTTTTTSTRTTASRLSEDTTAAAGALCSLTSMHQLERHLTQLELFVSRADREAPATVLALTLTNTMAFYYIILYTIRVGAATSSMGALTLISLLARSSPMVMLFVSGHALKVECARLLNKLEVIYLQQQSPSLIYKQMLDTQFSLDRVLRLTSALKFTCCGLMDVNLGTLSLCGTYVCASVFVVLQYDLLIFS